jgi:hypothetical protein
MEAKKQQHSNSVISYQQKSAAGERGGVAFTNTIPMMVGREQEAANETGREIVSFDYDLSSISTAGHFGISGHASCFADNFNETPSIHTNVKYFHPANKSAFK